MYYQGKSRAPRGAVMHQVSGQWVLHNKMSTRNYFTGRDEDFALLPVIYNSFIVQSY